MHTRARAYTQNVMQYPSPLSVIDVFGLDVWRSLLVVDNTNCDRKKALGCFSLFICVKPHFKLPQRYNSI